MSAEPTTPPAALPAGDIMELVQLHVTLRRMTAKESAGSCPFDDCGGVDRFRVWSGEGRYWCRGCGRTGDALDFLCQHDGMTLLEACQHLDPAFDPELLPLVAARRQGTGAQDGHGEQAPPSRAWGSRAEELVAAAEARLWADRHTDSAHVLDYLREQRGLRDETIRRARLGYFPTDTYDTPAAWGLPADEGKIFLPRGITIPCYDAAGVLWSIKTRRPMASTEPNKYHGVRGSVSALYGTPTLPGHSIVVLTEGEFDAILLNQEAGDLVGTVTLGSAYMRLEGRWLLALLGAQRLLVAYDADRAGTAQGKRLAALSARVRVVRPVGGKDLSDMYRAGGDLRAWASYQLARHAPALPQAPPALPRQGASGENTLAGQSIFHDLDREFHEEALPAVFTPPPPRPPTPPARFSWAVRWGRERGDLAIRDPFTGEWHQVPMSQCPEWWVREAREAKAAERLAAMMHPERRSA